MPAIIANRNVGTWHPVSPRKEKLIDACGIVIAEVFQLMVSGRWAYSRNGVMAVVRDKDEAKRSAEGR